MLYRLLKIIAGIGLKFFYKEIKVKNGERLHVNGPSIIIANHPNTLMDAIIVGYISDEPIHFMAKATFFSAPLKRKILSSLKMIPINRKADESVQGVTNKDSFEACYTVLEENKRLAIFPEGTSFLERHLRDLKSGAARIALETELRNNGTLGLKVIPVGINYLQAHKFRSSILIQVGQPIEVANYLADYGQNASRTAKRLTEQFRMGLEQSLVYSDEKGEEQLIEDLHQLFTSKYIKSNEKGVEAEVQLLKDIRSALTEIKLTEPWKIDEIQREVFQFKLNLASSSVKSDFLDRRFRAKMFVRQLLFSFIFILIGFPVFVYGLIHNLFQYKITDKIIPKITKEVEYYAALSVLIGLFLYPICYLIFCLIAHKFFDLTFWETLLYFISMPVSGILAFNFNRYLEHISFKSLFIVRFFKNKSKLLALQEQKNNLRKLLFDH